MKEIRRLQQEQAQFRQEVVLEISHYDSIQRSLFTAVLEAARSQGMSDKALDCLVSLSEVVKLLIFHLLDHKMLKLKIEQRDFTFLEDNMAVLDSFMERTVQLVIKIQRTTMSLLQGEKSQSQPITPRSASLGTPLSTNPVVPPLPPDLARKLKQLESRISSSRASMPNSHRISIMNDLDQAQKLEITRLEQQLVSLIEASSGRNNPNSNEARIGQLRTNPRDVTLEDLLAASRASSACFVEKKEKLDEATWGSELRGLYQNQGHFRRNSESSTSSNDGIPSPIPDTEGMYFLLHGEQPPMLTEQDSKEDEQKEVKKLHFSKKIKKREKQALNFTLESLERLVIHPDFRSNITSQVNTPPAEKQDQPEVHQYNEQIADKQKASLSSNAFIDPFITRQQTTIDAKLPSLSSSQLEKKVKPWQEKAEFTLKKKPKEEGVQILIQQDVKNKGVMLKQRETPLQSLSKRQQRLLIQEMEYKFDKSVKKQIPTPKQVMLKLPIRSPTTPEPGPLPPLIQGVKNEGECRVEDIEKKKKEGKNSLLENYMRRLEQKPKTRNLGQPHFGHKSVIGSNGARSTASQSFIRHC